MKRLRISTAALLVIVLLATTAQKCNTAVTDNDLQNVSKGLLVAAKSIGEFQDAVTEAHKTKLITTAEARPLVQLSLDLSRGGKEATELTRQLVQLEQKDRSNLLKILKPLIAAIRRAVETDVARIGNLDQRRSLLLILGSIESTLNTVQLTLALTTFEEKI